MRLEKKYLPYLAVLLGILLALGAYFGLFSEKDELDSLSSSTTKVVKTSLEPSSLKSEAEEKTQEVQGMIMVHVAGEVASPGVYSLEEGKRVIHAIEKAGAKESSDINLLNLARVLTDGEKIIVPNKNGTTAQKGGQVVPVEEGKISLNQADKSTLMELPSIGEKRSSDIIAYRESHGGFKKVEELKEVSGIGEKTYEKLKDEVTP